MPIERAAGRVLAASGGGDRRPAALPELGDGRVRAAGRGTVVPGSPAGRRRGSPRAARPNGRWRPVRPSGSRRAGRCPTERDAVVPLELMEAGEDEIECGERVRRARTCVAAGSDVSAGDIVLEPGARLGPRRSPRWPRRGLRRCGARSGRGSAILVTGSELRQPGEPSSARARSTSRTGSCSPPALSSRAPSRRSSASSPTTAMSSSARSSARSSASTCWSPPEALRSARTISCARSRRSCAWRRSSGASRSSPASRSRSALGATISSSTCPGIRFPCS